MKILSITLFSVILTGQVIAQEPGSMQVEGQEVDEILESLSVVKKKMFYTNHQKQYVFKVDDGQKVTRLILEAGDTPLFHHSDSIYAPNSLNENESSVHFYLPPINGDDILPFLPALLDYKLIQGRMMKKVKPSIVLDFQEKSCVEFVHQGSTFKNETDSVLMCFYNPYEEMYLGVVDQVERLCYRNHTVWTDSSGEYRLDHWFEPEEFGFVLFMFTLPNGDEMKIELVEVNES